MPADLPRVVRLDLATVTLPDWHPEAARSRSCPVYGYAIDHPDGLILFDTGVGADSDIIDELYRPQVTDLDRALVGVGLDPAAVTTVVNSHLHFDHCGQNPRFHGTDVGFVVGRAEFDAVADDPTYTITQWALPPDRQRVPVEQDTEIADGVTVLTAPGHTAGHLALLVEADAGRVVLGGQCVWHTSEFDEGFATPSNVRDDELRSAAVDTIGRLKALEPDRVVFAHCDEWRPHRG